MGTHTVSPYQQVVEKTRNGAFTAHKLLDRLKSTKLDAETVSRHSSTILITVKSLLSFFSHFLPFSGIWPPAIESHNLGPFCVSHLVSFDDDLVHDENYTYYHSLGCAFPSLFLFWRFL